jgi:hypothetical protein
MQRKHKVAFVTIVPSPYQRDLFGALAARDEIDLSVYYLESRRQTRHSRTRSWPFGSARLLVQRWQCARAHELAHSDLSSADFVV